MTNAEYVELQDFAIQHDVDLRWLLAIEDHVFTESDFYVHKIFNFSGMIEDLAFVNAGLAKPFGIPKPTPKIDIERELVQILEFELQYPRPIVAYLFVKMNKYLKSLKFDNFYELQQHITKFQPDNEPFAYMREES